MKKLFTKIQLTLAVLAGLLILAAPVAVGAQAAPPATPVPQGNKDAVCQGVALTGGSCDADSESQLNGIIEGAINIFSVIVGVAAVIMIMIGGFKYVTSNGDSNSVNSAKNTILYAIVGLIVVALAQTIVQFTLRRATETAVDQGIQEAVQEAQP